jgi:hypothetical protein
MASAVAPAVIAGLLISVIPGRTLRSMASAIVLSAVLYECGILQQFANDGRFIVDRRADWRSAVAFVNRAADDLPVFVRSGLIEADRLREDSSPQLRAYCLVPVNNLYELEADDVTPLTTRHAGQLTELGVQKLTKAGGAWFIASGRPSTHKELVDEIGTTLQRHGWTSTVNEQKRFGVVRALKLQVRNSSRQFTSPLEQ